MSLNAFAPSRVVDHDLLRHPAVLEKDATTLFVDLVGFTPLTDQLGRFGSRGTEQLSEILQGFFRSVTTRALSLGGDPVAYGGDALTIVFDGPAGSTSEAAHELARAIHELTDELSGMPTLAGELALQTRIGLARGTVTTTVARGNDRYLPIQLGVGLDRAVAAEAEAAAGQIVVHPSLASPAASREGLAVPNGHSQLAPGSDLDPEELARLIHPAVRGRIDGDISLLDSHRTTTAAFIGFPPVPDDGLTAFTQTASLLLSQVDDCGGEVVQLSGGDKGVVGLAVFGAPVGHDDDALRAVRATLELRRLVPEIRVGIATGPIFATWLGSDQRRFQGHFGRSLNVAARLMQAAQPREIVVEPVTWFSAKHHLRQRGKPRQLTLKGQPEPIEVRVVAGWRRRPDRAPSSAITPLAGRAAETRLIEDLLDGVQAHDGGSLALIGDAGIGKSRLAREATDRARTRGIHVLALDVEDYPYGQPQRMWRDLLADRLAIPANARPSAWRTTLLTRLGNQPVVLAALSPVLGLTLGSRGSAAALTPDVAVELSQTSMARLVLGRQDDSPALIVVENAHHLPPGARALLAQVQRDSFESGVGLLVTERPPADGGVNESHRRGVRALPELTDDAAALLVADRWRLLGGGTPPRWLAEFCVRRAAGNPLFLTAVTDDIRASWRPGDPPPLDQDRHADSLAASLAERLDLLPDPHQQVLAVLAVAGRPLLLGSTTELLADRLDAGAVMTAVQDLHHAAIVQPVSGALAGRYRIRHDVLRQLVYERLSHTERERLHGALAMLLVTRGAGAVEIAEHVAHLDDSDMGRAWYPLAASEARSAWDVSGAIGWQHLALPLLTGAARRTAEVDLLELLLVGGRPADVLEQDTGQSSDSTVPPDDESSVDLIVRRLSALAQAALSMGDFAHCEELTAQILELTDGHNEAQHQQAAEVWVRSLCDRGELTSAVAVARRQLQRAERISDSDHLTIANASLGAALLFNGEPSAAEPYYEVALRAARSTGDTIHEIHVLSDLAGCAFGAGDMTRCLALMAEARDAADNIGYRRHLVFSLNNEAHLRSAVGDRFASSCAKATTERCFEFGDLAGCADGLSTWTLADPSLIRDAPLLSRLAHANVALGRNRIAAQYFACAATAEAQVGNSTGVRAATEKLVEYTGSTENSELNQRIDIARALLSVNAPDATEAEQLTATRTLTELADDEALSAIDRAELRMSLWRLTPDAASRSAAVDAVRGAFAEEPSILVRSWFDELEVDQPPNEHPLPPPVGIAGDPPTRDDFEAALMKLEVALGLAPGD